MRAYGIRGVYRCKGKAFRNGNSSGKAEEVGSGVKNLSSSGASSSHLWLNELWTVCHRVLCVCFGAGAIAANSSRQRASSPRVTASRATVKLTGVRCGPGQARQRERERERETEPEPVEGGQVEKGEGI